MGCTCHCSIVYLVCVSLIAAWICTAVDVQEPFLYGVHDSTDALRENEGSRRQEANVKNPLDENFEKLVYEALEHWHVPGLSVSVVHGEETFAKGYGTAVFPSSPATADTLYYVGSTTKSFIAASILLLTEDLANTSSPLTLQTPVTSLIRSIFVLPSTYATTHATLEDLLSHRTGMPRHDMSYGGAQQPDLPSLISNLRNLPMTLPLRTGFQYCNMMYSVLHHIIETLSSLPLPTFLQSRIWTPLNMTSTYLSIAAAQHSANATLSRGYYYNRTTSTYKPVPYFDSPVNAGAGGIISTVNDFATYLRAMLIQHPFLSPASHAQLRTPRSIQFPTDYAPWDSPALYTLGWAQRAYRGVEVFQHTGSVTGYGALMAYAPSKQWGVSVLANTDVTSNFAADVVFWHLLDELVGTPEGERVDWVGRRDGEVERKREEREGARGVVYPGAPGRGEEGWRGMAVDIKGYAGTFRNPGYGDVTWEVVEGWCGYAGRGKDVVGEAGSGSGEERFLHARLTDRTWPGEMCLEHVSGEYFLGWSYPTEETPTSLFDGDLPARVVFTIGVGGEVEGFVAGLEPEMGEEGLWFGRVV